MFWVFAFCKILFIGTQAAQFDLTRAHMFFMAMCLCFFLFGVGLEVLFSCLVCCFSFSRWSPPYMDMLDCIYWSMLSFDTPMREYARHCTIRSKGTNTVLRPGESREGDGRKKKDQRNKNRNKPKKNRKQATTSPDGQISSSRFSAACAENWALREATTNPTHHLARARRRCKKCSIPRVALAPFWCLRSIGWRRRIAGGISGHPVCGLKHVFSYGQVLDCVWVHTLF